MIHQQARAALTTRVHVANQEVKDLTQAVDTTSMDRPQLLARCDAVWMELADTRSMARALDRVGRLLISVVGVTCCLTDEQTAEVLEGSRDPTTMSDVELRAEIRRLEFEHVRANRELTAAVIRAFKSAKTKVVAQDGQLFFDGTQG